MAGTFDILPQVVAKVGPWTNTGGTDTQILSGLAGDLVASDSSALSFSIDCTNNDITVDSKTGQTINDLPVGFNISTMGITYSFRFFSPTGNVGTFKFLFNQGFVAGLGAGFLDTTGVQSGTITFSITGLTFADLFGDHWFLSLLFKTLGFGEILHINKFTIHGTYATISGSFTIPSNTQVAANQNVTITATQNLDAIAGLVLGYIDPVTHIYTRVNIPSSQFVSQSAIALTFTIPSNFNIAAIPNVLVTGFFNGVVFSGEVVLGTLQIVLADASGIYVLQAGKATDTLYGAGTGQIRSTLNIALFNMLNDEFIEPSYELSIPFVNPSNQINASTIVMDEDDEEIFNEETVVGQSVNTVIINTTDVAIPNPFAATGFLP